MIRPDPTGRETCCGALKGSHFEDCPEWRYNRQGGYWYHPEESATNVVAP